MDGPFPFVPTTPDDAMSPDLGIVGCSDAIRKVRADILRFAPLPAPVLVTGDTGTGKELVARALHDRSRRARRPLIDVNAGALPASLIGSELFGHVRGAFTGAVAGHRGVFEQADTGTLFIDEVAELPLELQAWLLRVLETGQVRPIGGERTRSVDVRVVTATAVDLEEAVEEGRFRNDLYWRLAVLTVRIPRLWTRTEDIAPIAEHLMKHISPGVPRTLSTDALQALALHDWPGNVRELRAVLTRAIACSPYPRLEAEDMVRAIGGGFGRYEPPDAGSIDAALKRTHGNIAAAARLLGCPRSTLRDRLRARGNATLN